MSTSLTHSHAEIHLRKPQIHQHQCWDFTMKAVITSDDCGIMKGCEFRNSLLLVHRVCISVDVQLCLISCFFSSNFISVWKIIRWINLTHKRIWFNVRLKITSPNQSWWLALVAKTAFQCVFLLHEPCVIRCCSSEIWTKVCLWFQTLV